MRRFIGLLTCLLILTGCAAPASPTPDHTSESHTVSLDGTLQTSLLAVVAKSSPRDNLLLPFNPATGKALAGYTPISLGTTYFQAWSADRQTLAVISFPGQDAYDGALLLIDLPSWRTRRFELDLDGWVSAMAFSPDGKRLAIAQSDFRRKVRIFDVGKGTVLAQSEIQPMIVRLKFTEDGKSLMLYGEWIGSGLSAGPPQVLLLDAADLSTRWSSELEEVHDGFFPKDETITQTEFYEPGNSFYVSPGLDFAPDQDRLYVVHADEERLTTVDFSARKIRTVEIEAKLSGLERLLSLTAGVAHAKGAGTSKQAVVSPNGQSLYVVGVNSAMGGQQENFQMEQTPLGLEILRTRDGRRVAQIDTEATELSLSPDGRFLYLRNWEDTSPWSEVFDTTEGKIAAHEEAFYATPAFLVNGQFLLASTYVYYEDQDRMKEKYHMRILQPSDLSLVKDWTGSEYIYWLTH